MKCPNCKSSENWKNGYKYTLQGKIQRFRCKECDKTFPEKYVGCQLNGKNLAGYWTGRKLTDEHKRNAGFARSKWWNNLTPKEKAEMGRKISEGLKKNRKITPDAAKKGFIGMLGDIEVYALNIGRVGRSPKSVSAKWVRPAHGKPELKKLKPG